MPDKNEWICYIPFRKEMINVVARNGSKLFTGTTPTGGIIEPLLQVRFNEYDLKKTQYEILSTSHEGKSNNDKCSITCDVKIK